MCAAGGARDAEEASSRGIHGAWNILCHSPPLAVRHACLDVEVAQQAQQALQGLHGLLVPAVCGHELPEGHFRGLGVAGRGRGEVRAPRRARHLEELALRLAAALRCVRVRVRVWLPPGVAEELLQGLHRLLVVAVGVHELPEGRLRRGGFRAELRLGLRGDGRRRVEACCGALAAPRRAQRVCLPGSRPCPAPGCSDRLVCEKEEHRHRAALEGLPRRLLGEQQLLQSGHRQKHRARPRAEGRGRRPRGALALLLVPWLRAPAAADGRRGRAILRVVKGRVRVRGQRVQQRHDGEGRSRDPAEAPGQPRAAARGAGGRGRPQEAPARG
mmetsp:Transcript_18059/g.52686  ORF Transcript_18059/g.52686 Transcript_18059/m.52686 type:complete len:329 (+) Transcript_18059:566-1552(+)